jgi:hypothetical protein
MHCLIGSSFDNWIMFQPQTKSDILSSFIKHIGTIVLCEKGVVVWHKERHVQSRMFGWSRTKKKQMKEKGCHETI